MIRKQFFLLILFVGIGIVSCRQNDEITSNTDTNILKEKATGDVDRNSDPAQAKSNSEDSPTNVARNPDSIKVISTDPIDPPIKKDETHWKNSR